jgi:co-chaperonin GroES (HSP10)
MTIITPEKELILPRNDDTENEGIKIPTDPKGIKNYLDSLPNPVGYRMLIRPYSGKTKTEGGILLSEQTHETIQMTTVVGLVIKMGTLCYQDKDKFPDGAWCKEGMFVMYGRYAGSRFKTKYGEHRILNDDEIIGTINKPSDINHLY